MTSQLALPVDVHPDVLTGARVLRKTPAQLDGPFGMPEHVWEIAQ